jgi:hypothetical protein
MKNLTILTGQIALLLISTCGFAQVEPRAFYKKCLVSSITGGPSTAVFTTRSDDGQKVHRERVNGMIDPLIMEYGITDKVGVGFSLGGENYNLNAKDFYRAKLPDANEYMTASTKYFTLDYSYHPFVTKRIDVSLFGAAGYFKVQGTSYQFSEDYCAPPTELYSYKGHGAVIRAGVRSRIYFSKRFGFMAMAYGFNGMVKEKQKPNPVSDQVNNTGHYTSLLGGGFEFGLCFRIFKQKGVKQEAEKTKILQYKEEIDNDKNPVIRVVWE